MQPARRPTQLSPPRRHDCGRGGAAGRVTSPRALAGSYVGEAATDACPWWRRKRRGGVDGLGRALGKRTVDRLRVWRDDLSRKECLSRHGQLWARDEELTKIRREGGGQGQLDRRTRHPVKVQRKMIIYTYLSSFSNHGTKRRHKISASHF